MLNSNIASIMPIIKVHLRVDTILNAEEGELRYSIELLISLLGPSTQ